MISAERISYTRASHLTRFQWKRLTRFNKSMWTFCQSQNFANMCLHVNRQVSTRYELFHTFGQSLSSIAVAAVRYKINSNGRTIINRVTDDSVLTVYFLFSRINKLVCWSRKTRIILFVWYICVYGLWAYCVNFTIS